MTLLKVTKKDLLQLLKIVKKFFLRVDSEF